MLGLRMWLRRLTAILLYFVTWKKRLYALTPYELAARSSPLSRFNCECWSQSLTARLQHAKEHNVRCLAELLNGVVIPAGSTFSWHETIGPPLRFRGFVPGPVLRGGVLVVGMAGDGCHVSNLLFSLVAPAGLEIVERRLHARNASGCGAALAYPQHDFKLKNPHPFSVQLSFRVDDGALHGAIKGAEKLVARHAAQDEQRLAS